MENFQDKRIILTSYEADFAAKWGGKARDIILENQEILSLRFKAKNPAQHHWETANNGVMMTAGVGGPVTGKGANVFIIDDPVKNPLANSTPVTLSDGSSKLLGDIKLGDLVVTHRGRGRSVLSIFERGFSNCVKIKTYSGREVVAELSHPFLTLFGWKRAEELEVGNRLCMPKSYEMSLFSDRKLEEFRFTGYITGDGCCNDKVQMQVTDPEEKVDFEQCVVAMGLKNTGPGKKSYDIGALYISGGTAWAQGAEMHGKLAHTKVVPSWVFTAPNEHVANFIGAYFVTDGCVSSFQNYADGLDRGRSGGEYYSAGCKIQFDSVSKKLLEGVRSLLVRFSIYSKLRPNRVWYRGSWRRFWTLYVTSSSSMRKFIEVIPVHHSEKRVKLEQWGKYLEEKISPSNSSVEVLRDVLTGCDVSHVSPNIVRNILRGATKGTNYDQVGKNYVYDQIVSIEPEQEDCRCIEVEEDSSFLANGLVVHNSEEANSLTMREKIWDWYTSTARTRLEPGGSMVVIATRWNSDDLIGRLINPEFSNDKGTREEWEVFVLPACAEPESERHYSQFGVKVNHLRMDSMTSVQTKQPVKSIRQVLADESDPDWQDILGRKKGQALCPERYDENDLARIRSVNLRDWYALFQQRPGDEADDGNVYHQFDERKHCKLLDRNDTMQLFVSLDFNVDPMCCVIGQYQKGNGLRQMERCEVLEEIILPNSNTPNMMEKLLIELKKYQYGYTLEVEIYGDAAGTQRSSQSQKSNWQIVAEYFMLDVTIHPRFVRRKANPMIVDRVNAVNTMLKSADGSMRLFVDDTKCPELVKDFKKVRWQQDASGNSTGLLDKSDKRRTHISDAMGYCVEYNFSLKVRGGGRRGVLQ